MRRIEAAADDRDAAQDAAGGSLRTPRAGGTAAAPGTSREPAAAGIRTDGVPDAPPATRSKDSGRAHPAERGLRALIFDVDGTLADTERDGHRVACNAAFAALGIPIRWTWEEYRELLKIPGNQNRMRLALKELGTLTDAGIDATAARLFRIKQERYIELVPRLPLRRGVERLLRDALDRHVRLALVSTSSEPQIHALLRSRLPEFARLFDPVLGQQSGPKVGPAGCLYERCVGELGLPAQTIVAVEDAEDGFRAALRAGIACVVVPNDYTRDGDFRGAALVAPSLQRVDLDELDALCRAQAQRD